MNRQMRTALWVAVGFLVSMAVHVTAEDVRSRHQWGRFRPGAWKRVRIQTETFDERGNSANLSTTETYTVLTEVTDKNYGLRVEVQIDVSGKRFSAQPQVIRQGYYGETDGQEAVVRKVSDSSVSVGGQPIPSKIQEVVIVGSNSKRVMTMHISDQFPMFALKRDCKSTDTDGKQVQYTTAVEVLALDMPHKVLNEIRDAAFIKTVHKQGKNTTVAVEVDCPDVPGGVVSHSLREEDDKGRVIRRSTLELLDYGIGPANSDDDSVPSRRPHLRSRRNRPRTSVERNDG